MSEQRGAAEQEFMVEYTRAILVSWAEYCVRNGRLPDTQLSLNGNEAHGLDLNPIYVGLAQEKGWLTVKPPMRVTASGFKTAAAFLRR